MLFMAIKGFNYNTIIIAGGAFSVKLQLRLSMCDDERIKLKLLSAFICNAYDTATPVGEARVLSTHCMPCSAFQAAGPDVLQLGHYQYIKPSKCTSR